MINKMKLALLILPIFCFSMTFEENFSLMTEHYINSFSSDNEIKIIFPKNYKEDLNKKFIKGDRLFILFFPSNSGFNLLVKNKKNFKDVQSVRKYAISHEFKITHFQFISDIANFKNIHEINDFYLKYFDQRVDPELVEKTMSNHFENYFFPIKYCIMKLEKI